MCPFKQITNLVPLINGCQIIVDSVVVQHRQRASLRHNSHFNVLRRYIHRKNILEHLQSHLDDLLIVIQQGLFADLLFQVIYGFL